MARRRQRRGISTLLVLLGLVAILGGTFTAGFLAGRHWERVQVITGLAKPQAPPEPERPRVTARAVDPVVPALTFYQELTAPLASPPPRGAKPEPPRPKPEAAPRVKPEPAPRPEPVAKPEPPGPAKEPVRSDTGYTVQVAAYATRAQADGLVARLASHGFAADVSETTTGAGVRYRVRVGSYPTRGAARDAAARLATETRLGGFVAVR
ncbi:MAG: SPOR domain-containing protein [Candidatus Rokubacteria bacterium]|nr:SPOR domain-containing protein [Candidatus Rokubacteria bacterium]